MIAKVYNPKNPNDSAGLPPLLAYELLAHMLKHGFVDHIVSYNFDTLLETSITDELGDDGSELIVSEEQLSTPIAIRNLPRLIKIHGSVSVPSSLRFTLDETRALSIRMRDYLDELFFPKVRRGEKTRPVSIVSYGYSWNDQNLSNWLKSRSERIESVFVSRSSDEVPKSLFSKRPERSRRENNKRRYLSDKVRVISSGELFEKPGSPYSNVSALLAAQWRFIASIFNRPTFSLPYQSASRHIVSHDVFALERTSVKGETKQKGDGKRVAHSLENRLLVELFILLLKCKGMIVVPDLANDHRIQPLYKALRKKQIENADHTSKGFILDRLSFMIKEETAELKEVYIASQSSEKNLIESFFDLVDVSKTKPIRVHEYSSKTGKINRYRRQVKPYLRGQLRKIYHSGEVEIGSQEDPRNDWTFYEAEPIRSQLLLKIKTQEILETNWTHLLCIAESGEWLHAYSFPKDKPRFVGLVSASGANEHEWPLGDMHRVQVRKRLNTDFFGGATQIAEVSLPWFWHNRHLTLALNINGKSLESMLLGGLFFHRRNKEQMVHPVFLSNSLDQLELLIVFLAYFRRATEGRKDSNLDSYQDRTAITSIAETAMTLLCQRQSSHQRADYLSRLQRAKSLIL